MPMQRITPEQRARLKAWRIYGDTVRALIATLPDPQESAATAAPRIIDACRGMGWAAWTELDERSGYRDLDGRFGLVRQTRNSPTFGPQLIAAVNEPAKRRTKEPVA